MADIKEAIRRLIYQYTVEGADKVMATQEAVAASTTKTDKASLSLEKSFGGLERRYVETVRAQQDYAKVQDKVNAAVAQNPALQERANVVLAEAKKHFDNVATGASKADMAATVLIRTMSRTIGPLALVGVAVAAISSAMEFMEPIAVRVGTDIYNRFSQAYPAAAKFAESVYNAGKAFVEVERAQAKVEAIDAAMRGVASSAELAALNTKSLNDENKVYQRGLAEAALAAQRMSDHVMRLREIYPGVTQEIAKQAELLDAQLVVAKARTEEERQIAEGKLRQVQLTQQGVKGEEQQLIIAKERAIAEAKAAEAAAKDNPYYSQNQSAAANEAAKAQGRLTAEVDGTEDAHRRVNDQIDKSNIKIKETTKSVQDYGDEVDAVADKWTSLGNVIDNRLDMFQSQSGGKQLTVTLDPFHQEFGRHFWDTMPGATGQLSTSDPYGDAAFFDAQQKLFNGMGDLTGSVDALNATMQSILSPYYSQDPRTTKLGFRAGVMGNTDWLVPGATNTNPLAAILGAGATAPGMANGGSFTVGGGYSANDNKIAAFPVASGEQVVVNRNHDGGGAKVVNIDNRIVINGSVDADAMSQLKVSRYQQAQRMRAGLAQAS